MERGIERVAEEKIPVERISRRNRIIKVSSILFTHFSPVLLSPFLRAIFMIQSGFIERFYNTDE